MIPEHRREVWCCVDCGDTVVGDVHDWHVAGEWWNEGDGDLCRNCHLRRDRERAAGTRPHWWEAPNLYKPRSTK